MASLQDAIPLRWPSGPLDIIRGQKREGFTPQMQQTLDRWHQPAALDILKGAPVDCLVVSWAAGLPEDAQQQKTIAPLVAEALRRKLSVIGWVEGPAAQPAAIAAAKAAGLTALAIQDFKGKADLTVIPWGDRSNAPYESAAPVLPVTGNAWPGVQMQQGGGAESGPTGLPWVDSNGWYVNLARARTRAGVWVLCDPPAGRNVIPPQSYVTAVADAEAAGGRWLISLDAALRARLLDGEAAARTTWQNLLDASAFFQKRRAWRAYRPLSVLGVLSDYSVANFDMSGEILNLTSRLGTPVQPLWKQSLAADSFRGLKGLVYADTEALPADLRTRILDFVKAGGLLVTGPKWGPEGTSLGPNTHIRFDVRALGKGRIAVAKEELSDPYQLSVDSQILLSHANDFVRFFGTGASVCYQFGESPDAKTALLQLLAYGGGPGGVRQLTVWVNRKFRGARMRDLRDGEPVLLQPAPSDGAGCEFHIPLAPAYAALELEA